MGSIRSGRVFYICDQPLDLKCTDHPLRLIARCIIRVNFINIAHTIISLQPHTHFQGARWRAISGNLFLALKNFFYLPRLARQRATKDQINYEDEHTWVPCYDTYDLINTPGNMGIKLGAQSITQWHPARGRTAGTQPGVDELSSIVLGLPDLSGKLYMATECKVAVRRSRRLAGRWRTGADDANVSPQQRPRYQPTTVYGLGT